jgi:hypothetical protein
VTFNNEVTIFGDGTKLPVVIAGDKLHSYDDILSIGKQYGSLSNISSTSGALVQKLFSLEETGSTALGPALVASLGMATHSRGSKIVICTDGLSNVGLGSLDELYLHNNFLLLTLIYTQMMKRTKLQLFMNKLGCMQKPKVSRYLS